ncbi:right-handed parallel beta-helix repeat-containing protein [Blautia sp. Marseille-P3087]|uniref:right-handed parallel beta-helix repeat-containing protein n=1 Tax=Blautia sp. Marseille-P3087 TaxID=1917876 RepID=UPI0009311B44|nr:Ig-like domain-containing protein [Blautia sp. Marseille-P3087]
MRKKRLAKSVSLMLCAAMTVTMGSVPALAEDLGGDYYEIAFSDDAENFENPAETEPGIEESSEAEAVPEEASGEEDVAFDVGDGDSEQIDIVDDAQDEEELDIATEEMDVEDFGIAECAGEDGIAVFDDGMTQQGTLAAVYLDPAAGDDTRTGAEAGQAVKTLDKAKELLAEDGIVYLLSPLEYGTNETATLENMTICPGTTNLRYLIDLYRDTAEVTLRNIKIKNTTPEGNLCSYVQYPISVRKGATLNIEDGADIGPFAGEAAINLEQGSVLNMNGGTITGTKDKMYYSTCGIHATGKSVINMTGGTITGCAAYFGGAIAAYDGSEVNLSGGTISNNISGAGGGIYLLNDCKLTINGDCKIINNTAKCDDNIKDMYGQGGGIYMIQNCTATIEAGTIKGNTAEISGGGIFVYDRSPVIISNTTIEENKATNGSGAGIAAFDSDITLKNEAVISNNDAGFRGGGIFFEVFSNVNCELKMEAGEICGNTADSSGGGIFADCYQQSPDSTKIIISGGKITGNQTGAEATENAIMLMGYPVVEDEPDENTGYADLYLSGSPEIRGEVTIMDRGESEYGPKIVVTDDTFQPVVPILLAPDYGTPGNIAVTYGSAEQAKQYKNDFTTGNSFNRGIKQSGDTLIWTKHYKVKIITFTSFNPLEQNIKEIYVNEGESIDPADFPETAEIKGYVKTGWRMNGKDWDPTSPVMKQLSVNEVWTLKKSVVSIVQDKKNGCPSSAITLTAKAAHDLDTTTYTYQWYKNDEVLDGQTEATYVAKEGGEYKVVVTAIGAGSNAKSIAETSVKLPAFAHKYSWKSDKKNHWQVCSICNGKVKTAAHNYSGWKVTKAAQIAIAGEKVRTCKTCGHKEKAAVAALPVQKTPFLGVTSKEKSVTLRWNTVKDADGYMIYGAECGNNSKYRLLRTVRGNVNSWTHTGLKKATYYRYSVVAYRNINKKKVTIAQTYSMHIATTGKKHAYARNLQVNRTNVVLNRGKRTALRTKVIYSSGKIQNHIAAVRFSSSNSRVATVNSRGIISARNKGTCIIYCYAPNGVRKNVRVTVR